MFQAFIMFCILGDWTTCHSVYPDPVLPKDVCEAALALTLDTLRKTAPPESMHVYAFGVCKPAEIGG